MIVLDWAPMLFNVSRYWVRTRTTMASSGCAPLS
jgi:hypothetical protein